MQILCGGMTHRLILSLNPTQDTKLHSIPQLYIIRNAKRSARIRVLWNPQKSLVFPTNSNENGKLNSKTSHLSELQKGKNYQDDSSKTARMSVQGKQTLSGLTEGSTLSSPNIKAATSSQLQFLNKPKMDPPGQFPEPLIVSPKDGYRQTFIILHGRGSTAAKFAQPLLDMAAKSSGETLQTAFPHAKLIFLTASRNRATIYKRAYTHQWFDHWHMHESNKRQELMRDGLHKSCEYVHGILEKEIGEVGKENVVLWGLSQGCATSLTSLLTWDGAPFAATVGMCGYLPFANHIEEIARGGNTGSDEEDDDPFSNSGDEDNDGDMFGTDGPAQDGPTQAVTFLREEIEMEDKAGMVFRQIPVFLGHGTDDEKVDVEIGREARTCLDLVGADVRMVEYQGLGHWYSEEMLGDIFEFVRERLGITNAKH